MIGITFFTPVSYQGDLTCSKRFTNAIEDYFHLSGRRLVITSDLLKGNFKNEGRSLGKLIMSAIKISSYMTLFIPLIMMLFKVIFRHSSQFTKIAICKPVSEKPLKRPLALDCLEKSLRNPVSGSGSECGSRGTAGITAISKTQPPVELIDATRVNNVRILMEQFTQDWRSYDVGFDFTSSPFQKDAFISHLQEHAEKFKKSDVRSEEHFGSIEKFDLELRDSPQIFVRADLHGDLKSLIENLRTLQKEGLLDEDFRCRPGVRLVFLGNYCDRGDYGTQILEMLMYLREENPGMVHIIRGNHEYLSTNRIDGSSDHRLCELLDDTKGSIALLAFYETMSLTTYLGVSSGDAAKEYVQFTHGLFEPSMDPAPLLDSKDTASYLPVPKTRTLSDRVNRIADGVESALATSAKKVKEITYFPESMGLDKTAYNWANVRSGEFSWLGGLGGDDYQLTAPDIRHCLDLSSDQHKVMMIFRGHQNVIHDLMHNRKVLVTTLPVGADVKCYASLKQPDRAYIITPKEKVETWQKRVILRKTGQTFTTSVSKNNILASFAILGFD